MEFFFWCLMADILYLKIVCPSQWNYPNSIFDKVSQSIAINSICNSSSSPIVKTLQVVVGMPIDYIIYLFILKTNKRYPEFKSVTLLGV